MNRSNSTLLLSVLLALTSACSGRDPSISATATAAIQPSAEPITSPVVSANPEYKLIALASRTPADRDRAVMTRVPPPDLGAANAEGRIWLGESRYAGPLPPSFTDASGTSELICSQADLDAPTRSGDWVLSRSVSTSGGEEWTLIGADQERLKAGPAGTLLRARALDGSGASHVIEVDRPSQRTVDGISVVAAPVDLPSKSNWVVVVTSEQMWGCFLAHASEGAVSRSTTVVAAEARGAGRPRVPEPAATPSSFNRPFLQGSAERRCAEASNSHTRSADWMFDPLGYAANWGADRATMKTAWIPLHQKDPGSNLTSLTVSGTLLGAPQHSYTYISRGWVQGDGAVFFATGAFVLPAPGDWLLEATSGQNWGCFIVRLTTGRSPAQADPR